ncbi:hemolysin family protein [Aggregatibacter actinomycetemcomitans]|uniref:hemolysin family protein n=1 Tax=Aggregatibacter actinomycetemcomitans TaxID=714 RepID=UPI00022AD85D|nr:hemolysin family protein [Aggregatibacter actinomycetemcomitans]KOE65482.1 membrane protein [Aggregatibacter actinomycetemcomitans serotype e str. A160]KOE68856.1 membrane protein [Aggregatibacter actinomycetemcomitans serotype e str. SCC393]KOE70965.1 membrane protein [Aggregatibacter actinomycetemcomitans serotype f str. D18P1]KYK78718.1 membrane protein [Aggregatibacter actinomycetemcomitans serotype e str. SA2876]KYK86817.1 membrane protein [Aggregatibacter actinomycetemcomitans serotyp
MSLFTAILVLILLIIISAVVSSAEISLAGARRIKLQNMVNEGNTKAAMVLKLQEQPGRFITVVQIGLNMVAVLGGVIGEATIRVHLQHVIHQYTDAAWVESAASWMAFFIVTASFILLADLMPKRLAMTNPEVVALRTVRIMQICIFLLKPIVWVFDSVANFIFRIFKVSTVREESMTSEDIVAVVDAGAEAGVLKAQEHYLIENIFDMQQRTVTSTMTTRENIIFLDRTFTRQQVLDTLTKNSHSKLLICDQGLDHILGYVESHSLLTLFLKEEQVQLTDNRLLRKPLFVPDTLSLYEVLELFKSTGEDFAVIVNEYALVVGIVTLNDVMSIVMGELVSSEEEQIIRRDEDSWLVDGATPLEDVKRALDIEVFPHDENYETIAGFMMYMLRKIPKKTDFVLYGRYKFEIIDTENFKIDQLMVSFRRDLEGDNSPHDC